MLKLKEITLCLLSFASITYIINAVCKFLLFLSKPQNVPLAKRWMYNILDTKSAIDVALAPIAMDIFYIQLFTIQHSLMKINFIKKIYEHLGLLVLERTVYSTVSAFCLQKLVENWQAAYSFSLWSFEVKDYSVYWWLMISLHVTAWYIIFAGCFIMDLPELLGLKQIYYHINGYGKPSDYKSNDLKRLYGHMRHPSVVALLIVLWTTNIMSLDRLLLATMFTIYIIIMWRPDKQDFQYQLIQRQRKMRDLKYKFI